MEVDGGGESCGGGFSGEVEKNNEPEGEPKLKRRMKTPSQLEILEKTYAVEAYPSEALRAELSVKLGLSDRQLQMWFCHRRLKDRKVPIEKRPKKTALSSIVEENPGSCADEMMFSNADEGKEHSTGLDLSENMHLPQYQERVAHKVGTAVPRLSADLPSMRGFYEPPLAVSEQRAIASVEAQLGKPLREDGPILGMEFDPLPPGAFGSPIGQPKSTGWSYEAKLNERLDANPTKGSSKPLHEYQFLPEKPSVRNDTCQIALPHHYYPPSSDIHNACHPLPAGKSVMHINDQLSSGYCLQAHLPSFSLLPQQGRQGHHQSPASGEVGIVSRIVPLMDVNKDASYTAQPKNVLDNHIITSDRAMTHEETRMEKKRKTEEARIAKEVEAHSKRIRKELEKQNILRRKREEQLKREMERKNRECQKEEERMLREKLREEERYQRECRREMERRQKFIQKEYIKAERMRLKEEIRREKEAVRLKAANNRAAARKLAKESMDLIDDERLELLELAALSRGLTVDFALDANTIQNLDFLKDKLPEFPPNSVHLKRPFGVQPWTDNEMNVGNLIMVWKFLITFADVLGLWPFTLDEFVQSFYDSYSRLLEEIHIALLRLIIKDIKDVAKTPALALAGIQNSSTTPGGLQIVEGAYAWGFDVFSWQRHLSPLTWAEVLRQFALSAGFGPKLKKQNKEPAHTHDDNEVNDGAEIISNLRSGLAAENAVAFMQERGFSNHRKSRHRLTPGTVKFAAFHILSLVGSEGLSIFEVAEKIQKSGLRDLTTSKTPEASISAALSRDTKLFERTAPSTYCVRSPYRKDPGEAELIILAAREKIRLYLNGNADGNEADDAEKEDAERDQDSESDVGDDPDADDLDTELKPESNPHSCETSNFLKKKLCLYGKEKCNDLEISSVTHGTTKWHFNLTHSVVETKINRPSKDLLNATGTYEKAVINDCNSVESWVQGLTQGEYADLSIEERLNALVALIGVANEGTAIRLTLEERLEAANALKKQMWSEAQLDKRRMKEDHILKFQHSSSAVAERRSPVLNVDMKNEVSPSNVKFRMVDLNDQHNEQNFYNDSQTQEFCLGSETLLLQQSIYASEKSRSELKVFISHCAEEMYVYRSLPLGLDRRHNRYWRLTTSPSQNDPCSGRIYVELRNGVWRLIDSEEDFDALLSSLDVRGTRESHLHAMLLKIKPSFKETSRSSFLHINSYKSEFDQVKKEFLDVVPELEIDSSKSVASPSYSIELEKDGKMDNIMLERCNDFVKWMWDICFKSEQLGALKYSQLRCNPLLDICECCHSVSSGDEEQCPSCHTAYHTSEENSTFLEHDTESKTKQIEGYDRNLLKQSLPLRIRLLKAQLATIEARIPPEALKSVWSDEYRKSWGMKLLLSTTATELLEALTLLEDSIRRDFLCKSYRATCELLMSCSNHVGHDAHSFSRSEAVAVLPWIPQTTPAVALRLLELDSSIYYTLLRKEACRKDVEAENHVKLSPRTGSSRNYAPVAGNLQQERSLDPGGGSGTSLKRGRGRPKGPSRSCKKSLKMADGLQDEPCLVTPKKGDKLGELPDWKGWPRGQGGRRKGRRFIESGQKHAKRVVENVVEKRGARDNAYDTSDLPQVEWDIGENAIEVAGSENASTSEGYEFDDEFVQASADEYNDLLVNFSVPEDYKSVEVADRHEVDGVNYIDDAEGDDREDEPGDCYIDGYFNSEYHEENQSTGGQKIRHVDKSLDRCSRSSSSDYSF